MINDLCNLLLLNMETPKKQKIICMYGLDSQAHFMAS